MTQQFDLYIENILQEYDLISESTATAVLSQFVDKLRLEKGIGEISSTLSDLAEKDENLRLLSYKIKKEYDNYNHKFASFDDFTDWFKKEYPENKGIDKLRSKLDTNPAMNRRQVFGAAMYKAASLFDIGSNNEKKWKGQNKWASMFAMAHDLVPDRNFKKTVFLSLGLLIVEILVNELTVRAFPVDPKKRKIHSEEIANKIKNHFISTMLEAAVFAPLIEEFIFRGLPSALADDITHNPNSMHWKTGIISSLIFAVLHDFGRIPLTQFIGGLFFWQLQRTKGFAHNALAHGTHNAAITLVMKLFGS